MSNGLALTSFALWHLASRMRDSFAGVSDGLMLGALRTAAFGFLQVMNMIGAVKHVDKAVEAGVVAWHELRNLHPNTLQGYLPFIPCAYPGAACRMSGEASGGGSLGWFEFLHQGASHRAEQK